MALFQQPCRFCGDIIVKLQTLLSNNFTLLLLVKVETPFRVIARLNVVNLKIRDFDHLILGPEVLTLIVTYR